MFNISAVIITKNEEKNIELCLKSLDWADEIIIYDSGSTDQTLEICEKYKAKVYQSEKWEGFGIAKRTAVAFAQNDWVFVIDADEEVSPELKNKLLSFKGNKPEYDAYRIRRISYYSNKRVRYSGWQNDFTLRLFNQTKAGFNDKIVHESVVVNGTTGVILEVLNHYTYPEIQVHIKKMTAYSMLGAEQAFNKGKKSSIIFAVLNGLSKFIKMYFIKLGILDGKTGLILAVNSAFGVYLKYIYLWEKWKKN